jgi:acyl-[acyl-carrier-protein]-phospholipid O-acyltransferase/long-chain-fatty-acid--[acyl-carrier-protein] ligase
MLKTVEYFTDKYKKNRVIIATKIFEVLAMFMAVYYLSHENKLMLVVVLFLLSSQAVFLSPAKYGIIPEWFNEAEISRVNGMVQLTTFIAIIFIPLFYIIVTKISSFRDKKETLKEEI